MIGNLSITNYTFLFYALARYLACPKIPNPVTSVDALILCFLNNDAAAAFKVHMLFVA